jgi:Calpain family cysteine protease
MFIDNGDGTWTVRFYYDNNGTVTPDYVTVDRYLPTFYYAGRPNGELWIAVIEKAFAQWDETGRSGRWWCARNAYDSLEGGWDSTVFMAVLGDGGAHVSGAAMRAALDNHYAVDYGSVRSDDYSNLLAKYGIVSQHAYAVTGYYYDSTAGDYRYILKNPWGWGEPIDVLEADMEYLIAADPSGSIPAGDLLTSAPDSGGPFMANSVAAAVPASRYAPPISNNPSNSFVDAVFMSKTFAADITTPPRYGLGFAETRLPGSALSSFQSQMSNYSMVDPTALHWIIENEFEDLSMIMQADAAKTGSICFA